MSNVPDMPDPGAGAQTFFYTNQQSARLMFYHDHAWGITRLNVYAGEAAAYIIQDEIEQQLVTDLLLPGANATIPLVVQDKTFVSKNILAQDPTWDAGRWGGEGSLWAPHVYMPAQNPGDASGMSSFGRWMYGPWFWPPNTTAKYQPIPNPYFGKDPATNFTTDLAVPCSVDLPATWQYQSEPFCEPALIPGTPNISVGMEAFNDTPIVNGTAYPKTTVDPKAYRIRVLNAANDRFWNLSWYVADPRTGTLSEVALNPAEVAAAQNDPVVFPTPDETYSPKGPNWIQIGTEGGFLPAPVVVPAQPTTWITDPTRFDVGNVDLHSLLLAPAERADTIVDFSQFAGKTLILYNDAPAAFPARVPGYDYYTGGPDLSPAGAPTTLPGYGPNTRTIMQVKVASKPPAIAYDRPNTTNDKLGQLMTAFAHKTDGTGVFESGQNPIIVGQAAYNSAYGSSFVGTGWCNSPTNPSPKCDGFLRINEQGGTSFKFDGLGTDPANVAGPQLSIPIQPKGIHDEMNSANFDEFGRMTANMGLEAPGATPLLQNIILYPFVNPATEVLDSTGLPSSLDVTPIASAADGTQIWKITHNGVDTHPLHFHLYDVQLINRVTWDNIIIPPEPTELGWKETVRVSPLEDTIVAVRPIQPTLPFGVLDSHRPYNPMMPIGAKGSINGVNGNEAGFNNTDANGNPIAPITNVVGDFGWEYVWHCHILSHEEMDMMRPVTVHVGRELPTAPVLSGTGTGPVNLTWTDGTPVNYTNLATWGGPTMEVGYRIERATVTGGVIGAYAQIGTALANQTTFTDTTAVGGTAYSYRVVAFNAAGDSTSNTYAPTTHLHPQRHRDRHRRAPRGRPGSTPSTRPAASYVTSAVTDAGGAYTMTLPVGGYKLWIQSNAATPTPGTAGPTYAGATPITWAAARPSNVTVAAAPSSSTAPCPAPAGPSRTSPVHVFDRDRAALRHQRHTAAGGHYAFTLPAGSYKLWIQPPAATPTSGTTGPTSTGPRPSPAGPARPRTSPCRGTFILSGTRDRHRRARSRTSRRRTPSTAPAARTPRPPSPRDGHYAFTLPAGSYKLWIQPPRLPRPVARRARPRRGHAPSPQRQHDRQRRRGRHLHPHGTVTAGGPLANVPGSTSSPRPAATYVTSALTDAGGPTPSPCPRAATSSGSRPRATPTSGTTPRPTTGPRPSPWGPARPSTSP